MSLRLGRSRTPHEGCSIQHVWRHKTPYTSQCCRVSYGITFPVSVGPQKKRVGYWITCHSLMSWYCIDSNHWTKSFLFFLPVFCMLDMEMLLIPVAARCKAWTVFARSNAGTVGSNSTWSMNGCVRLFCVCVVLCAGSGLATDWSPRPRSPIQCV
jgi:hypothetical protein